MSLDSWDSMISSSRKTTTKLNAPDGKTLMGIEMKSIPPAKAWIEETEVIGATVGS